MKQAAHNATNSERHGHDTTHIYQTVKDIMKQATIVVMGSICGTALCTLHSALCTLHSALTALKGPPERVARKASVASSAMQITSFCKMHHM